MVARFRVFTPNGTHCVVLIKQSFLLSLALKLIFFILFLNFIDKGRYVDPVVLSHDLGWLSCLLKITWHH